MPQTTITHLSSVGSDHCPLLMEMETREDDHIKYFKFLNCWTDQPNFLDIVKACWDRNVEGNNMWKFHQKMKRLSNTLSNWSRKEFGDIFAKVREYEENVKTMEEQLIQDNSEINRAMLHELNAKYIRSGLDTIEHIFNTGQFATYVWRSFAEAAGIITDHSSLTHLIIQWWSAKYNNEAHKLLLQATPLFICWNLWKNRCASKYGGKSSNISRVKYAIYKDNYKLMNTNFPQIKWPSSWKDLFQLGENCIHDIKVTLVKWIKPPARWIKINTDGSALSNPGRIGAGGILRDQMEAMLLAFATPLGEGTNNQAEIGAAFFGMTWAIQLGYKNVVLEVDSQLLVDWIMQRAKPPWSISTQLQQLQELIRQTHNFRCKHTFREANFVADSLSKRSHKLTCPHMIVNFDSNVFLTQFFI
uniref:RNase H family protein n=1 Tax=Solanum tuberosum TaxID=4113 RepID=M1DJP7_SOLTU